MQNVFKSLFNYKMNGIAGVLFVLLGIFAIGVSADEAVLLDFALLIPDTPASNPIHESNTILQLNDLYPSSVGLGLSDADRNIFQISLAIPYWTFTFNSSFQNPNRINSSGLRISTANANATQYAGQQLLGMRLNFPEGDNHSSVLIQPPYKIPRMPQELISGKSVSFSNGQGVIENVDQIETISVNIYGLNYPHQIAVLYEDVDGIIKEYILGDLRFRGWRTLTWNNPRYTIRAEGEQIVSDGAPAYPKSFPNIAFRGFRILKSGAHLTGDFVGYIKDFRVTYDSLPASSQSDFDDEREWNILTEQLRTEQQKELIQNGVLSIYETIKNSRKATE